MRREKIVKTRREVLKYAGLGAGVAAASAMGVRLNAASELLQAHAPTKAAQTEVTDASGKRLSAGPEITWTKAARNAAAADVTVEFAVCCAARQGDDGA